MLKIIQVETDEHKFHIQKLFWEYFNETKLIFSHRFGINLDVDTFFEQYMTQLHEFIPPSGRLLLGQSEAKIVGCACLRKIGEDVGEIKRMYVRPEFRSKGIGRSLLEAIINEAVYIRPIA
ncbi:MAG: GNAT family N-acetyltransferase [Nostoc sp.]|uniref:GNAT family N-acetyltransferase n=1 Tax=Nostoc sp. TaxID=1180 RepID=UPI002FF860AF